MIRSAVLPIVSISSVQLNGIRSRFGTSSKARAPINIMQVATAHANLQDLTSRSLFLAP